MAIKRLAILLAAALILSGCGLKSENDTSVGNNSMAQEKESSNSETINAHVPVTIKQGSERITLYELPPYSYSGDDIYMKGICEYFSALSEDEREWQKKFAVSEGKGSGIVYIPIPVIMKTETKDDKVYVYGRFWDMWYALDGKNLYCLGGGENAGRLEMKKQDGVFKVTGFEKVGDGSYYPEDWKRLCGEDRDLYERFFTKEEREDRREIVRGELIFQYAQDNGLDIESYQDFGWDPVLLPESDFITAESVEGVYRTFLYEKFPLDNIKVMMADLTHDNHDEMIVFERYESDSFTGALHIYHISDGDEVIEVYKDDVGGVQTGWRWYYLFNDGEGKEQLVQYIPGIFGGSGVFALDMISFSSNGSYIRDNIASVTYDTIHFDEKQQIEMKKQLELFKEKLFQYKDASKQLVAVGDDMYLLKEESMYFGGDVQDCLNGNLIGITN